MLYGRREQFVAAAGYFVGHCDDGTDVIAVVDEGCETLYCKLGGAEKNYSEIFFCHNVLSVGCVWLWAAAASSVHRRSSGTGAVRFISLPETGWMNVI